MIDGILAHHCVSCIKVGLAERASPAVALNGPVLISAGEVVAKVRSFVVVSDMVSVRPS